MAGFGEAAGIIEEVSVKTGGWAPGKVGHPTTCLGQLAGLYAPGGQGRGQVYLFVPRELGTWPVLNKHHELINKCCDWSMLYGTPNSLVFGLTLALQIPNIPLKSCCTRGQMWGRVWREGRAVPGNTSLRAWAPRNKWRGAGNPQAHVHFVSSSFLLESRTSILQAHPGQSPCPFK